MRKLRRTEYADLGNPPTESERLYAWQDPDGREPQQYGHSAPPSPDPYVVPAPPTPESQLPQHPVSTPVSFAPHVNVVRPRDSSGRFLPRSDSRDNTPNVSADSPRMQNEPGSSSRDGQQIYVGPSDYVVRSGDSEVNTSRGIAGNDDNSNPQRVPSRGSDEHSSVESQLRSPQTPEIHVPLPRRRITTQQFERNVRARTSTSSVLLASSSEAALAFSASSLEPACLITKQWKKIGVELSYPVTADMFENPEDDWLATASSRARARPESRHSPGRIMTMRWVHTWKVSEDTGESKAKARLVVEGFTRPDLTKIRSESPTLSRLYCMGPNVPECEKTQAEGTVRRQKRF